MPKLLEFRCSFCLLFEWISLFTVSTGRAVHDYVCVVSLDSPLNFFRIFGHFQTSGNWDQKEKMNNLLLPNFYLTIFFQT